MNNIIKAYQDQKELLLSAFDQLIKDEFVPCTVGKVSFETKDIESYKNKLIDEEFYVSICGQIKAGKSTFLNYLLFQDKMILPTAPTPWTAKITKIRYAEKDYVRIHFYSKEEWDELKTLTTKDEDNKIMINYFDEYLSKSIEESARNGIYGKELIGSAYYELNDFDMLDDYISSKGLYTPFVSQVELFVNNTAIKNVVIVDTPGINDPNSLRSKVTTDFINQSSAVVYLFYSVKPLDITDLNFIDQYLSAIASSKIVFGAAKCDLIKDGYTIAGYIEKNLISLPELKERHIIKENFKVYPFSTIAAIIKFKLDKGITLSEDELYLKKRMSPELTDDSGHINNIISAIEENIMNDKAADVLNNASHTIFTICKSKLKEVLTDINIREEIIDSLSLNIQDLNSKIDGIKELTDNIEKMTLKFTDKKNNIVREIEETILSKKDKIAHDIKTDFGHWLNGVSAKKAMKISTHQLKYILYNTIQQSFDKKILEPYFNVLKESNEEIKEKIKTYTKEKLDKKINWGIEITPLIQIAKIRNEALVTLLYINSQFEESRENKFLFFIDDEETKNNISLIAANGIDLVLNTFSSELIEVIRLEFEQQFLKEKQEIDSYLKRYFEIFEDLKNNFSLKSENEVLYKTEIENLRNREMTYRKSFETIKSKLAIPNYN